MERRQDVEYGLKVEMHHKGLSRIQMYLSLYNVQIDWTVQCHSFNHVSLS